MTPVPETIKDAANQLITGKGVSIVTGPSGNKQVAIEISNDMAERIAKELEAEREGSLLHEYIKTHAQIAASAKELNDQKEGWAENRETVNTQVEPRTATFKIADDRTSTELIFADNEGNLKIVTLPFDQITEFKKVADPVSDVVYPTDVFRILSEAGMENVVEVSNWEWRIGEIEKRREKNERPKIEF
jgi:hypothetical protein